MTHNLYSAAVIVSSRQYAVGGESDEKVHGFEGSKLGIQWPVAGGRENKWLGIGD